MEECAEELMLKRNDLTAKKKELALTLEQVKESEKQFKMKSLELASKEQDLGLVRESIELTNYVLEVKRKMVQLLNNEIDSKSKESRKIQKLIEELTNELVFMQNQHDSIRSTEIKDRENELELLKNQIESEEKKFLQVKREIEEVERELQLKKRLRHMSTVLVNCEKKQQPISDRNAADIDSFMVYRISASLTRHEISSFLRATPKAAEFVLELVGDEIKRGSTFLVTFLENLVLIFEELPKIQKDLAETDKSTQLHLQATEVATPWKEKTPKSSLEALAFLLFIMAFGLKTMMNEEETALLASSIAQYQQAPILFKYLSINREFVEDLIKKSLYVHAVKLICLLKLKNEVSFSPSELLKKEIINFRRSNLENSSTNLSSQAKEKDGGRLRAILEHVADYKLEIDLPRDLMVEGERLAPVAHLSVENVASSSNPQAGLKKKTVLLKHTGVNEENLGTTLLGDVDSINETSDSELLPPIIHIYQKERELKKRLHST